MYCLAIPVQWVLSLWLPLSEYWMGIWPSVQKGERHSLSWSTRADSMHLLPLLLGQVSSSYILEVDLIFWMQKDHLIKTQNLHLLKYCFHSELSHFLWFLICIHLLDTGKFSCPSCNSKSGMWFSSALPPVQCIQYTAGSHIVYFQNMNSFLFPTKVWKPRKAASNSLALMSSLSYYDRPSSGCSCVWSVAFYHHLW